MASRSSVCLRSLRTLRPISFLGKTVNNPSSISLQPSPPIQNQKISSTIHSHILAHLKDQTADNKLTPYRAGYALQTALSAETMTHPRSTPTSTPTNSNSYSQDKLILLEHEPVYTLGRSGDVHNFTFEPEGGEDWSLLSRNSKNPALQYSSGILLGVGRGGQKGYHDEFIAR